MGADLKIISGSIIPMGPRIMPVEPWRPSMLEMKALSSDASLDNKLGVIMAANREHLWVEGSTADIKLGRHLAGYVRRGYIQKDDVDNFDIMTTARKESGEAMFAGWSRGLDRNVHMKIGRTNVLVMDDHLFAAPYIINMHGKGVIGNMSSMVHIDDHKDGNGTTLKFDLKEYLALPNDYERISYLYAKTWCGAWLYGPLFNNYILNPDPKSWRWFCMDDRGSKWQEMPDNLAVDTMPSKRLVTVPGILNSDVVDIDLDVLNPVYRLLSKREKRNFAAGKIPYLFRKPLNDMADIAVVPRVTTIATSPAFFNQPIAIVCARELLALMQRRVK